MAKRISRGKEDQVMSCETLSQKILAIAQTKHQMGEFIPDEVGVYWRIGQTLAWHAEDWLEKLALDLRTECGKSWQVHDLVAMAQLYFRHPTLEGLSVKCAGQRDESNSSELFKLEN